MLQLHRYDPTRGQFVTWMYGIARNKWRRWARTGNVEQRARQRLGIRILTHDEDDTERICAAVDADTYHQALRHNLAALPTKLSIVVQLRVLEDRSYREISTELGITEAAARKRLSRALDQLATRLEHTTSPRPEGPATRTPGATP